MTATMIGRTQLQILLARIAGAKILSLCTATLTEMNKTNVKKGVPLPPGGKKDNPFWGKVASVRKSTYQPCYDYGAGVERARFKQAIAGQFEGEIEFETGETWYNRVVDAQGRATAFGMHKDTGVFYFASRMLNKGKTTYIALQDIDADGVFYPAGATIPYEAFAEFVTPTKPSAKQGLTLETQVNANTLKFSSIRAIKHEGETYRIDQPLGLEADEVRAMRTINDELDRLTGEAD